MQSLAGAPERVPYNVVAQERKREDEEGKHFQLKWPKQFKQCYRKLKSSKRSLSNSTFHFIPDKRIINIKLNSEILQDEFWQLRNKNYELRFT